MPFIAPTVSSAILSQMIARGIVGKSNVTVANAVANACSIHFLSPATISLVLSGTAAGPGTYISTPIVGVTSAGMTALMMSKSLSLGWLGKSMNGFFDSISSGIFYSLPSLVVTGVAVGVGLGVGVGRVTGFNQTVLENLIRTQFFATGVLGKSNIDLATIISTGIVNHILASAVVNVTVVGAVIPPPAGPIPVTGIPGVASFI